MDVQQCEACGAASAGLGTCAYHESRKPYLCKACKAQWLCPDCTWHALSFELDTEGLPKVLACDDLGQPPPGSVRIDKRWAFEQQMQTYMAYRQSELNRLKKPQPLDPLHEYLPPPQGPVVKASGSGVDAQSTGVGDTIVLPPPKPLRVMSWNLQDLGGGPSRGAQRSDMAILRIACVIAEAAPDICALLEVKLAAHLPKKPEPPPLPRETRRTRGAALTQKAQDAHDEYLRKLDEWEQTKLAIAEQHRTGVPTGKKEVLRIFECLKQITHSNWGLLLDPALHTESETYAFFYRTDGVAVQAFELIHKDAGNSRVEWPETGFRAPARVTFKLGGSRLGRTCGKVDEDWLLDMIAFHAPAPHHGEKVPLAIANFAKIAWPRETVFAGDFNVDTEVGDVKQEINYAKKIEEADSDEEAEALFDRWSELAYNVQLDNNRQLMARFFSEFDGLMHKVMGDCHWLEGVDLARTSMRAKIKPCVEEHFAAGMWSSTNAFQCAAYDKIALLTPKSCDARLLQPRNFGGWCFPLFEFLMPKSLRPLFKVKFFDDGAVDRFQELVVPVSGGGGNPQLQQVLNGVKEVSDHVPVLLDLEIHPKTK
ncbi:hypothetical protein SAMN02745857_02773 [Andreprevotia lacus DSM 23236]|jgi:endonuclease/exonuclease/phosphatase family metal-dependent hydrolase|uniref:Endonuclease/Exonuclease/phosphatase family protein n=1 Tax=Andreprevotia lacus DSM 23236 TaxID=1121001 RepID=A0A1W1XTH0_9NEIS|nr:hypothetical protein [Andreprevotia lacus]SMC27259.1 hypothetical protein SAMN02745857_02773 [Andreprevotia lacus DSM 23236]